MTTDVEGIHSGRHRPIQIVHSFEGLANGLDAVEVMPSFGRPRPYDVHGFEARVRGELKKLVERGVGGIAVNVGYEDYLENEDGWNRFLTGLEMAAEMGLRIWLYDENGYPSGSAGGLALKGHPELEAVGMKRIVLEHVDAPVRIRLPEEGARVFAVFGVSRDGKRDSLPAEKGGQEVALKSGRFDKLEVYFEAPLFEGTHAAFHWTSRQRYINVLDKRAVNRFLTVTHRQYFKRIPKRLWSHVQAVFTDEPSLMAHVMAPQDGRTYYPSVPWAEDLSAVFHQRNGYSIAECIRSLFEGSRPEDRKHRRDFWGVVTEMYEQALAVQSAALCNEMNIAFSGHLLAEENLWSQAVMQGNALDILRNFQIPGVDVLSCKPKHVNDHFAMALKTVLSAAVLGGKRSLMVEVGEYHEYWTEQRIERLQKVRNYWEGPRNGNPLENIKYTLALLFLVGVREYAFYFPWRQFSKAEYNELCGFVARLNSLGEGATYKPTCALHYPIETIWEEYIPTTKHIWGAALEAQSDRCRSINRAMTDTCKTLFFSNIQYILADSKHCSQLPALGIQTLLYPAGEKPDPAILDLCRRTGVELVELTAAGPECLPEKQRRALSHPSTRAGAGVIYACYDRFVFLLNTTPESSSFAVAGCPDAVFPARGDGRTRISGTVNLGAYECAFVYAETAQHDAP